MIFRGKKRKNTSHLHAQLEAPRQHQRVQARGLEEHRVRDRNHREEPAEEAREGGAERAAAAAAAAVAASRPAVATTLAVFLVLFFFLLARWEGRRVDPLFGS